MVAPLIFATLVGLSLFSYSCVRPKNNEKVRDVKGEEIPDIVELPLKIGNQPDLEIAEDPTVDEDEEVLDSADVCEDANILEELELPAQPATFFTDEKLPSDTRCNLVPPGYFWQVDRLLVPSINPRKILITKGKYTVPIDNIELPDAMTNGHFRIILVYWVADKFKAEGIPVENIYNWKLTMRESGKRTLDNICNENWADLYHLKFKSPEEFKQYRLEQELILQGLEESGVTKPEMLPLFDYLRELTNVAKARWPLVKKLETNIEGEEPSTMVNKEYIKRVKKTKTALDLYFSAFRFCIANPMSDDPVELFLKCAAPVGIDKEDFLHKFGSSKSKKGKQSATLDDAMFLTAIDALNSENPDPELYSIFKAAWYVQKTGFGQQVSDIITGLTGYILPKEGLVNEDREKILSKIENEFRRKIISLIIDKFYSLPPEPTDSHAIITVPAKPW